MTTQSSKPIVCECGHEGTFDTNGNDHPLDNHWESYSLSGFVGGSCRVTSYRNIPNDILAHLKPKCPECGEIGKVRYA